MKASNFPHSSTGAVLAGDWRSPRAPISTADGAPPGSNVPVNLEISAAPRGLASASP